jgi:hypothetical protein
VRASNPLQPGSPEGHPPFAYRRSGRFLRLRAFPEVPLRRLLILALGLALAACSNSKRVKAPVPPAPATQDVVNFSTYLGNDLADSVRDIALDSADNLFVVGAARSADLLPGSPVAAFGGNEDAFVAKFGANGALLWWTFVGGPGPDGGYAIGLDGSGDVVIGGSAAAGFPVTGGALLTQFQGGAGACDPTQLPTSNTTVPSGAKCDPDTTDPARDGFVAKLAGASGSLQWATYFGSGRFEVNVYKDDATDPDDDGITDFNDDADARTSVVRDVAVDSLTGAIYLTFTVVAPNQRDPAFVDDPMVTGDQGALVGNLPPVIVAALALGERPLRPALNSAGGGTDGILAKLTPNGAALDWATFVGGTGSEGTIGLVELDAQGNPVVVFATDSTLRGTAENPVTKALTTTAAIATHAVDTAVYNNAPRVYGSADVFISKYDPNGARLWATHIGGSGTERLETGNLALRSDGGVVLALHTDSTSQFIGPVPSSAFDPTYNGSGNAGYYSGDCGIFVLSPNGTLREGATYYGGALGDACTGVAVDSNNRVYVSGGTHSPDLPVRASPDDPYQSTRPGARSGFLAVFSPDLTALYYGGYFGGTGLGQISALRVRQAFTDGARLVFGGEAGAGYPLAPATPVRGTVTAPPEHGVVTDARIFF